MESKADIQNQTDSSIDIQFAQKLTEKGGKFVYCDSHKDLIDSLNSLKEAKEWNHICEWEEEIKQVFDANNFQSNTIGLTLENSNAGISRCVAVTADDSIIFLSPKQASRRRLPIFPETHIILLHADQIKNDFIDALDYFKANNKDELPSIIDLSAEKQSNKEVNDTLILPAPGPKDVYVFLCDEVI